MNTYPSSIGIKMDVASLCLLLPTFAPTRPPLHNISKARPPNTIQPRIQKPHSTLTTRQPRIIQQAQQPRKNGC